MRTTSQAPVAHANETVRHASRETDRSVGDVLSNIARLVLWTENTAPELAAAIEKAGGKCSVRQAERYLGGHCEWSGDAVATVMQTILLRRGMRNVKIAAREGG